MEFNHFSPQAFEHLIQALSVHVLGPGTVIFGTGPDGGREATFEGEVSYPSEAEHWNGYIVVQAKCKEQLQAGSQDADWLAGQLKEELKKFLDRKRGLRKPQYYILASNVKLSAQHRVGGKAKISAVFDSYKRRLGLKGFAVWSPDELRVFLESATGVRRAYTAWLTPSDVLAELLDNLRRPNLQRLLPLALGRDLRAERDVRLRDAGQETEKPINLEDVFIDLPIVAGSAAVSVDPRIRTQRGLGRGAGRQFANSNSEREDKRPQGIVARLLVRAADKLDPAALETRAMTPADAPGGRTPLSNRIVILGGPGQGKSTLGQFLAQVMRAQVLKTCPKTMINPQTRDLIAPILSRAQAEGLWLGGPIRFPIRIDLPAYADVLDHATVCNESLPLIQYFAQRLSRELNVSIDAEDLRLWLGACPALVVLDGLDEVPPSSNRDALIQAIDALWDDIFLANGDVLVVVTTRPQGYHQDLNPEYWQHWELAPLSIQDAMKFAQRLAAARLSDPERQKATLVELNRASEDLSTKMLMTSPLQVTVLFGISLLKGNIPQDRWDLFDKYYTLLRDREAQKPGKTAALIRNHKRQIDALHYEAGFLLQVMAEESGGANPYLADDQFCAIIQRFLRDDEYTEDAVADIANDLVRVATQRLVLLASRVEGRIAFDIRSLQEFMAAAQISVATQVPLSERLRAISRSAHWRHVFRIIASKVFSAADLAHFRADVVAICHCLDSGDLGDDERIVSAGGRLALDLLEDGIAATTPAFRRQLVRRALARLDVGFAAFDQRIIRHFSPATEAIFREELITRIQQGAVRPAGAAWRMLFHILAVDSNWAERLILAAWPDDNRYILDVLADSDVACWTPAIRSRALAAQRNAGLSVSYEFTLRIVTSNRRALMSRQQEVWDVGKQVSPLGTHGPIQRGP
jgi:hypothetical protein